MQNLGDKQRVLWYFPKWAICYNLYSLDNAIGFDTYPVDSDLFTGCGLHSLNLSKTGACSSSNI